MTKLSKPKNFFLSALPLFLVLFIDSMGLGLVFPILNALVMDPNAHFISTGISPSVRSLIFGMTVSIFMFCWFFGAAILGDLSDQIGRKKSLFICLLGAFIGYIFSAIAVLLDSFTLLVLGRMIAGFTAGSQSIAQAAIVDLSLPEYKARNLGMMLFVMSLGFVFGPLAGGVLSDNDLLSFFSYATPFYFAAIVSLANIILLLLFFHETFTHTQKIRFKISRAIEIFISAFKNEKVRELSVVLLVLVLGWSSFYSFISMFLLKVYYFSSLRVGLYMGVMGIGFGVGTGLLIEPCTKYFSLKQCVIGGALISAFFTVLTVTAPHEIAVWFYVVPLAATLAIAYSTLLTLFSNQVDADSQGWVMGITGSIMAFAFGVTGTVVGLIANVNIHFPLMITIAGLALSSLLMKVMFKER
ncbi:MAG TPA: MFS transporter [Gammaproteobacteria bacterium]|nr:MFS transporter [Gammaproteobacteria bacterium]